MTTPFRCMGPMTAGCPSPLPPERHSRKPVREGSWGFVKFAGYADDREEEGFHGLGFEVRDEPKAGHDAMELRGRELSTVPGLLSGLAALAACLAAGGCLGPAAVRSTRMRYNEVVRSTNDEQLLMNLVRLRYADSPVFIDLPNITSQFELSAGGSDPGPGRQPDQLRDRRADGPRHADPELPPPPGSRDRQGAAEPALGRPVQRGQRRGEARTAPLDDPERHQRRAERGPGHDPGPARPRRQRPVPPRRPAARGDRRPGRRRDRVLDERGRRERLRPDPRRPRPGARPPGRGQGRLRLPRPGATAGWPSTSGTRS